MTESPYNFPHVVRIAFGRCFASPEMRKEVLAAVKTDNSGMWDKFGGSGNVTWFVNGRDVAEELSEAGAANVRLIDERPLVHDQSVSFWYNKTSLILSSFREFGSNSKILYVDCDVTFVKKPDDTMARLLSEKIASGSRILSPVRQCRHPKRVMLPEKTQANKRTCPCNCLMYCEDESVLSEMLLLYPEVASLSRNSHVTHWTGTETTTWDDETVSMYWFDKSSSGECTVQDVVDAFEPAVIRLKRHPPEEADAVKNLDSIYLVHH